MVRAGTVPHGFLETLTPQVREFSTWSTEFTNNVSNTWPWLLCGQAQPSATSDDPMAFTVAVQNVDSATLLNDPGLTAVFAKAIEDAVASSMGLELDPESVELMAGPHMIHCVVAFPCSVSGAEVHARLAASTSLRQAIISELVCLERLSAVLGCPVYVAHVGDVLASSLAGVQGTWGRHSNTYTIRGDQIFFPSGGRADIVFTGPRALKIMHSSGVELEASLRMKGRELRWSNGSVWSRMDNPKLKTSLERICDRLNGVKTLQPSPTFKEGEEGDEEECHAGGVGSWASRELSQACSPQSLPAYLEGGERDAEGCRAGSVATWVGRVPSGTGSLESVPTIVEGDGGDAEECRAGSIATWMSRQFSRACTLQSAPTLVEDEWRDAEGCRAGGIGRGTWMSLEFSRTRALESVSTLVEECRTGSVATWMSLERSRPCTTQSFSAYVGGGGGGAEECHAGRIDSRNSCDSNHTCALWPSPVFAEGGVEDAEELYTGRIDSGNTCELDHANTIRV